MGRGCGFAGGRMHHPKPAANPHTAAHGREAPTNCNAPSVTTDQDNDEESHRGCGCHRCRHRRPRRVSRRDRRRTPCRADRGRAPRHDLRARRLHAQQAPDRGGRSGARRRAVARIRPSPEWLARSRRQGRDGAGQARARPLRRLRAGRGGRDSAERSPVAGYRAFVDDRTLEVGAPHARRVRPRGHRHRLVARDSAAPACRGRSPRRQRRRLRMGRSAARRSPSSAPASSASSSARRCTGSACAWCCSDARATSAPSPTPRSGTTRGARSSASSTSNPTPTCGASSATASACTCAIAARDGSDRVATVDYVLAATGRTPNVHGLGLENTSLALDARGVPRVRSQHDAVRDLADLHRGRRQRRPAAAARGRRRGPHRRRERRALPRRAAFAAAHAARRRVLGTAARGDRGALRGPRAGHVRHRRGVVRGSGTKPRHAAQHGPPARLRRHRAADACSGPR